MFSKLSSKQRKILKTLSFFVVGVIALFLYRCILNSVDESPSLASFEDAKKMGVFLDEYHAYPSTFLIEGKKLKILQAWTEKGWDFVGICWPQMEFTNKIAPYHFNISWSDNIILDGELYDKFTINYSFAGYAERGRMTSIDGGTQFRFYVKKTLPDTIVVNFRGSLKNKSKQLVNPQTILLIKERSSMNQY